MEKATEFRNKNIEKLVPSSHTVEFNSCVDSICNSTGHTPEVVTEALFKSNRKKIIMTEVDGRIFIKRNEIY